MESFRNFFFSIHRIACLMIAMTYVLMNNFCPCFLFELYNDNCCIFRDATQYKEGAHIKELSKLNRDLKNVIVIDWNKNHVQVTTLFVNVIILLHKSVNYLYLYLNKLRKLCSKFDNYTLYTQVLTYNLSTKQ